MLLETKFAKLEHVQNEEFIDPDYNAPLAKEIAELPPETPPTPNDPPWNSLMAFGVWFLSVLAIFLFPVFFIVPYVLLNRQRCFLINPGPLVNGQFGIWDRQAGIVYFQHV